MKNVAERVNELLGKSDVLLTREDGIVGRSLYGASQEFLVVPGTDNKIYVDAAIAVKHDPILDDVRTIQPLSGVYDITYNIVASVLESIIPDLSTQPGITEEFVNIYVAREMDSFHSIPEPREVISAILNSLVRNRVLVKDGVCYAVSNKYHLAQHIPLATQLRLEATRIQARSDPEFSSDEKYDLVATNLERLGILYAHMLEDGNDALSSLVDEEIAQLALEISVVFLKEGPRSTGSLNFDTFVEERYHPERFDTNREHLRVLLN